MSTSIDLCRKLQLVCEKSSATYAIHWAFLPAEGHLYEPMITVEAHYDMPEYIAALQQKGSNQTFATKCYGAMYSAGDDLPGQALCTEGIVFMQDCTSNEKFLRPLMAKDFGIKSIMCIPWKDGVIELGSTHGWEAAPEVDLMLMEDLPMKEQMTPSAMIHSQSYSSLGGA